LIYRAAAVGPPAAGPLAAGPRVGVGSLAADDSFPPIGFVLANGTSSRRSRSSGRNCGYRFKPSSSRPGK
jgi:hypothetical protein